jgi:hypothetical protein
MPLGAPKNSPDPDEFFRHTAAGVDTADNESVPGTVTLTL